jgi:putative FmdB family regulatory protein
MPIYEYLCSSCQKSFEHLARTLSDKPAACPLCGSTRKLTKQLSTFAPNTAPTIPVSCGGCPGASGGCPSARAGGCGGH